MNYTVGKYTTLSKDHIMDRLAGRVWDAAWHEPNNSHKLDIKKICKGIKRKREEDGEVDEYVDSCKYHGKKIRRAGRG